MKKYKSNYTNDNTTYQECVFFHYFLCYCLVVKALETKEKQYLLKLY